MSLDVYLEGVRPVRRKAGGIFIRENGSIREISRAEWDERCPGYEPRIIAATIETTDDVFSANITHNLGAMARAFGLYEALWRPGEVGIETAQQLIEPLRKGLELLHSKPGEARKHNPTNGWGSYEGLMAFVASYLQACEENPSAKVRVCR